MGWNTWNKFGCNVSEELIRGYSPESKEQRRDDRLESCQALQSGASVGPGTQDGNEAM